MSDSKSIQFNITIQIPDGTDDEIDRMTYRLLGELKDQDVESVKLVSGGIVPVGTKAAEPITAGTIALAVLPTAFPKIIEFLQTWASRGAGRTIKFKGRVADQNIEFEGSFAEMEKLVAMLESQQKGKKKK